MDSYAIEADKVNGRYKWIDMLKGIGIISVVVGHFIEPFRSQSWIFNGIYLCIYMFHMPLFAVCSGLLAKFSFKDIILKKYWIYFLVQEIYLLFNVIQHNNVLSVREFVNWMLYPYWHLWYLFCLIFWECSVPMLKKVAISKWKNYFLGLTILVSLSVGFIEVSGCVSRIICFYPFFVIGVFYKDSIFSLRKNRENLKRHAVLALCAVGVLIMRYQVVINSNLMLNYTAYRNVDYKFYDRGLFYVVASALVCMLVAAAGSNRILEKVGRNCMTIYLFHILLYSAFENVWDIFSKVLNYGSVGGTFLFVLISSAVITAFLTTDFMNKLIWVLFNAPYRGFKLIYDREGEKH